MKKISILILFILILLFSLSCTELEEPINKARLSATMHLNDVYIGTSKSLIGYASIENLGTEEIKYFEFNFEIIFSNGSTHTGLRQPSEYTNEIPIKPGMQMPIKFSYSWSSEATVTEVRITRLYVYTIYSYYDYGDERYKTEKLERTYIFDPPLSKKISE